MSHGGVAPRRPDQHEANTPRTVQPGGRATQVTNSKTAPLTVQIINKPGNPVAVQIINQPGTPVIVQDGGVLNMNSVQGYANDGGTDVLVSAASNVNGLQLWALTMSSVVVTASGSGVQQTDDVVEGSGGQIFGALVSGFAGATGAVTASAYFDLKGQTIPAGHSVSLVNGSTGYTHRTSAVLGYTLL